MKEIIDLKPQLKKVMPTPYRKEYTETPENWRKLVDEKARIEKEAHEDYNINDPHYAFMLDRTKEQNKDNKNSPYHTMTLEDFVKSEREAHIKSELQFAADALNLPPLSEGHNLERQIAEKTSLIMDSYVNAIIQDKGKIK